MMTFKEKVAASFEAAGARVRKYGPDNGRFRGNDEFTPTCGAPAEQMEIVRPMDEQGQDDGRC
jgi:hypothetical protein